LHLIHKLAKAIAQCNCEGAIAIALGIKVVRVTYLLSVLLVACGSIGCCLYGGMAWGSSSWLVYTYDKIFFAKK